MTPHEAESALEDAEVVPCVQAGIGDAKEILSACLDAEIPAVLDRADCCGKSGCHCAPKASLCVRPDDVPRVAALMRARWEALREREEVTSWSEDEVSDDGADGANGDDPKADVAGAPSGAEGSADSPAGEPACPACGHEGALVEGACAECGLQLG